MLYIYIRLHFYILARGEVNTNSNIVTQHQQQQQYRQVVIEPARSIPIQTLNVPTHQTLGGIQTTGSSHSVSSADSSAEMAKYFPNAQTPNLPPSRYSLSDIK